MHCALICGIVLHQIKFWMLFFSVQHFQSWHHDSKSIISNLDAMIRSPLFPILTLCFNHRCSDSRNNSRVWCGTGMHSRAFVALIALAPPPDLMSHLHTLHPGYHQVLPLLPLYTPDPTSHFHLLHSGPHQVSALFPFHPPDPISSCLGIIPWPSPLSESKFFSGFDFWDLFSCFSLRLSLFSDPPLHLTPCFIFSETS